MEYEEMDAEPFVRRRGKNWYFRIKRPNDYGIWKWTELKGGATREECIEKYYAMKEQIGIEEKEYHPDSITLQKAFEIWFEEYVELNTRYTTQKSYRGMVERHIYPALGALKLKKVTPRAIQHFINVKHGEMGRTSLAKLLAILKQAMAYAVSPCCLIDVSPATNIRIPRDIDAKPKKTHVFSPQELVMIEKRFPPTHHYYVPLHICLYAGLRIGEALGLRWEDIDLKNQELSVRGTMMENGVWQDVPKTKSSFRTIMYGEKLQEILKAERKRQAAAQLSFKYGVYNPHKYVCCRLDSGYRISGADMRYFNKWCKETFGEGSTHSLRHTHATMLLEAGESLEAVSKHLGHTTIMTTSKYYSHVTEKGKSQLKNTMDAVFPVDSPPGAGVVIGCSHYE